MNSLVRLLLIGVFLLNFAGVDFDLVDDALTCGTTDDIMQENVALTISAWIYPRSDGESDSGSIIRKRNIAAGSGVNFRMAATDVLTLRVNGSTILNRTTSTAVTVNVWSHVLLTWDGSTTASNVHIYINGTEASYATTTNGVSPVDNASGTVVMGNVAADSSDTFDGIITEVGVWQTELTAQEIAILASSRVKRMPLQIQPASLDAYWPLDEEEDGSSANADTFINYGNTTHTCTGDDGANNTGLSAIAEQVLSYA